MAIQLCKNILEKFSLTICKRDNSPSQKMLNKSAQIGTQIGQINNQHGLTYSEAKDLVNCIVDNKLVTLQGQAEAIAQQRIETFKKQFKYEMQELSAEELPKLKEPDTQNTLLNAAQISGRKQDEQLRNLLAKLVIKRIQNDASREEALKDVVYNEAISTINKLTVNQIKIGSMNN